MRKIIQEFSPIYWTNDYNDLIEPFCCLSEILARCGRKRGEINEKKASDRNPLLILGFIFSVMSSRSLFTCLKQWSLKPTSKSEPMRPSKVKGLLCFWVFNLAAVFSCLFVFSLRVPHKSLAFARKRALDLGRPGIQRQVVNTTSFGSGWVCPLDLHVNSPPYNRECAVLLSSTRWVSSIIFHIRRN